MSWLPIVNRRHGEVAVRILPGRGEHKTKASISRVPMHRFIHPLVTSPVLLDHCCLEFDFTRISKQFPNNVLRQQLLVSSFKPTDLPCRPLTERQCRCSTGCT